MPEKIFYLSPNKQEPIRISWKGSWKKTTVSFNDVEIGSFEKQKDLKKGKEFELDSDRKLSVKLKGSIYPELELLVNDEFIEGSPSDPKIQLKHVSNLAMAIGGFSVAIGLLAELFKVEFLLNIGIGIESIIYGAIIILLAFGVKRKSRVALGLIMGLLILDIIGTFWMAVESEANPTSGIIIKVFFMIYLFKGFGAIKKLKEQDKAIYTQILDR